MPSESALVVLIPEAEALVESFREQYDPSALLGMPAHVTILYPFKSPEEITTDVIQSLAELFSRFSGFSASFVETNRFPTVLYLSPVPDETFRRLIQVVTERFPETPPYIGKFVEVVPHLTVADVNDPQLLEEIAAGFERAARNRLPIHAVVREVALMDNEKGRWQVRARFALGTDIQSS